MARRPLTFKQLDVTRAIKASRAAGVELGSITVGKNGDIVLIPKGEAAALASASNEWDEVK